MLEFLVTMSLITLVFCVATVLVSLVAGLGLKATKWLTSLAR